MIDVAALCCPHCGSSFTLVERSLRCAAGHCFDIARQGYVNLLGHAAPANADTADMIASRERFLGAGHYTPLADAVAHWLPQHGLVLDAGAGPGWYLARWLNTHPELTGIACDVSPAAARRAARAHPRITAVVADTWAGLPVVGSTAAVVTSIFAPRNVADFARVLTPGGTLVLAAAGPDHLASLRAEVGLLDIEEGKRERLAASLAGYFDVVDERERRWTLDLDANDVTDLMGMGPNAFHIQSQNIGPRRTEAHVVILRCLISPT